MQLTHVHVTTQASTATTEVDTYFSEATRASWLEELPAGVELKSPFTGIENITDAFAFLLTLRGFRLINGEPSLSENARVGTTTVPGMSWDISEMVLIACCSAHVSTHHVPHTQNAFYHFLDDLDNIAANYTGVLDPTTLRLLGGGDFGEGMCFRDIHMYSYDHPQDHHTTETHLKDNCTIKQRWQLERVLKYIYGNDI